MPIDLGSAWITTTTIPFYERLKRHFGIDRPTELMERNMQVCHIDEEILRRLSVDTRFVSYNAPESPSNQSVELGEGHYRDPWGIEWRKPPTSFYYDLHKAPLAGEITKQDVMNHPWPEPDDPGFTRGLRPRVEAMRAATECALVLNLSLWVLQCSQNVRGYEDWYVDLATQPALLEVLADCLTESMLGPLEAVTAEVGDLVDVISVSDDIGHQDRLCMSPATYRRVFKPRHARMMQAIRDRSSAPVMWHTCGSVVDVIDDLAEIGVDCLNPVQTTAARMDPESLKTTFGDRMGFWGGIDTVRVLNHGSADDVRREVRAKIGALAPAGGYILNPTHNVQPDVPVENLLTMIEAGLEYGAYPLDTIERKAGFPDDEGRKRSAPS
ncbi:MAG TPA: uroporphyrinogen decarboxylase family protein [Anaerolineales bacterium]|nr:uroporphyrinogen decarboxylase family protein [Anaerolineales bacterium]